MINLNPDERIDDLQCKGYSIIQNPQMFCFGMDAVLLSDFTTGNSTSKVIDLGTGTGIIPILMKARNKGTHFTGLEIQPESVDMAKRSVILNEFQDEIDIVCGDIKKVNEVFEQASFDVVTSNPPYISQNHGLENELTHKNIARHEILLNLEDVIKAGKYLLKVGGYFSMVHKPFRTVEIIKLMTANQLEPKRICYVQPYMDKEPNMVLIEARKGGNTGISVEPALVVYNEDGSYTKELLKRYNMV